MKNIKINFNKENVLLVALVVILATIIGYYLFRGVAQEEIDSPGYSNNIAESDKTASTDNNDLVKITPVNDTTPAVNKGETSAPNLDRPLKFSPNLSDEAKKIYIDKINEIVDVLKEDPTELGYWMDLGIYRKAIGDYEGAAEVWVYVGGSTQKYSVAYNNLGDLYGYYIKDYEKAEMYFKKALEATPNRAYVYRSMFEFYHNVLKDDAKAREILQKGIDLNLPDSADFQSLLNNLDNL